MNEDELQELIGLWVDGTLPEALRSLVEAEFARRPALAADAATLRQTARELRAMPAEHPDPWFVEKALTRLLRVHDTAEAEEAVETRAA